MFFVFSFFSFFSFFRSFFESRLKKQLQTPSFSLFCWPLSLAQAARLVQEIGDVEELCA